MKLAIIIMIILFLGAFYVVREQQTNFKNFTSISNFTGIYLKWIGKLGKNITTLAVSAYHMKWLPDLDKKTGSVTIEDNSSKDSEVSSSITITLPD